jgi:hypothetical protein
MDPVYLHRVVAPSSLAMKILVAKLSVLTPEFAVFQQGNVISPSKAADKNIRTSFVGRK